LLALALTFVEFDELDDVGLVGAFVFVELFAIVPVVALVLALLFSTSV